MPLPTLAWTKWPLTYLGWCFYNLHTSLVPFRRIHQHEEIRIREPTTLTPLVQGNPAENKQWCDYKMFVTRVQFTYTFPKLKVYGKLSLKIPIFVQNGIKFLKQLCIIWKKKIIFCNKIIGVGTYFVQMTLPNQMLWKTKIFLPLCNAMAVSPIFYSHTWRASATCANYQSPKFTALKINAYKLVHRKRAVHDVKSQGSKSCMQKEILCWAEKRKNAEDWTISLSMYNGTLQSPS